MTLIRKLQLADKHDVLHISSQIWDGDDYIANVFDDWVKGEKGIFAGYWENDGLVGFGRMRFLSSTDIWLEALRKDPNTNITGVGYKIAQYYMKQLKGKKVSSVRFSTYFGNIKSIKLNQKLGFNKILTLSLKEIELYKLQTKPIDMAISQDISLQKINQYIVNSPYLNGTRNFIGKGWVVHKYSKKILEGFITKNQFAVYIKNNRIKGSILFSKVDYKDIFWISFLEADNGTIYKELLNFAIIQAIKNKCNKIQILVPANVKLMKIINAIGFTSWEQNNDFLLFELPQKVISEVTGVKNDT